MIQKEFTEAAGESPLRFRSRATAEEEEETSSQNTGVRIQESELLKNGEIIGRCQEPEDRYQKKDKF